MVEMMKLTCDWPGGYVGCVRDLVVRGTSVKLGDEARTQDPGSVKQGCQHRWVEVRAVKRTLQNF